ncbi:MAG: SusD family protein [Mucilaginibacter sp.]|nr:SusD family protein [Mucilaginibacter sp.]
MKNILYWIYTISLLLGLSACRKSEFLNKKPITNILTPTTLTDFQNLLENTDVMNLTGGLAQISADEYVVSDASWPSGTATERNSYIWAKDIYAGDVGIQDWNELYQQVFYANNVLDGLAKSDSVASPQGQYVKGWALFIRAFAFYDLTRTFCKAYDASTATTDLGIPLKLKSGIDNIEQRATLQQSFEQIFSDLTTAAALLPATRPSANLNRPSKMAVYALLARIYLDMRNYVQAGNYANQCLGLYNTLIDYNTVSTTAATPFSTTNDELIYNAHQVVAYGDFTINLASCLGKVPATIINSYAVNDLRLPIYFAKLPDGTYYRKRGYYGLGLYSFTGLATDELYLIKAECLARNGQTAPAMGVLNQLLIKRNVNTSPYIPLTASTSAIALTTILSERRKELMWRGIRWYDLKRLNKEGADITLSRIVNGTTYSLLPNDNHWVLPIPGDEIALSGIQQNPR